MDDKKINDRIKESSRGIEVPESLRPENIEKKLEASKKTERKKNRGRVIVHTLEAAAVLAVVFFAGEQIGRRSVLITPEESTFDGMEKKTDTVQRDAQEQPEEMQTLAGTPQQSEEAGQMQTLTDTQEQPEEAGQMQMLADTQEQPEEIEGMQTFASTSELYEKLREYIQSEEYQMTLMARDVDIAYYEEAKSLDLGAEAASGSADSGNAGYSQTNLREASVDEGDIIKTDGDYIYIMKGNSSVVIVDVDGTELEKISVVEPEQLNETVRDLYIDGDRMILVTAGNRSKLAETQTDVYEAQYYDYIKILTYDISDRSGAKLLGATEQEGYYQSSRKNGQFVYAFTKYEPEVAESEEDSDIMPLVGGSYLRAVDVYAPEKIQNTGYLVAGAVNIEKPDEMCSRKAIVSGAETFYVSGESIFIINRSWESGSGDVTDILKFSYKDGEIKGVGSCRIKGYLNDTFSLDEYNGYLRAVVTDWSGSDEINALYVFDKKLDMVGKIEDIAPGETIRSARFMGDTGYFVTFRQTDPLFSVDLSDPSNPQILGELKVSGFSSYLHFYGEDRLLGIGYEADEKTGETTGIKLSMFDVSDPADVKELKRYVLKDAQYLPALSNYKAVMIDPQKNLFGFVCDSSYMVFTYDETKGFENLLTYKMDVEQSDYGYGWYNVPDARGVYIGDTFYLMESSVLRAFDMTEDFTQKEKLEF